MNEIDYINKMVGTPWVRGSDSLDNGGLDCWGLVTHSFAEVDGVELPKPEWRDECKTDKAGISALASGIYHSCEAENGAIVSAYKDGAIFHVGRVLNGYVLHSDGSIKKDGEAVAVKVRKFERMYRLLGFEIKYYKVVI